MKKQVAVLICAISFDNQGRILEGIMEGAKKMDINVFVFTCHVNFLEPDINKQGAFHIMDLPDFTKFDGVIIVKNTIQYARVADKIVERIRMSKIPAVSIDEDVEGLDYVGISSYQAERAMVEHVISKHDKRNIYYVSGQLTNKEGIERYHAYTDVLMEHEILLEKNHVYNGNYDVASGREAVRTFLKMNIAIPEAIICANDSMAVGAISQLSEFGYRVPEDVLVTGFDADEIALYHVLAITTIQRNQEQLGLAAIHMLMTARENENRIRKKIIPYSVFYGHSCGCPNQDVCIMDEIKGKYVAKSHIIQQAADSIKNMSSEFAGLENKEDLYEVLKKYVVASDMQSFYLCMCDEEKVFHLNSDRLTNQVNLENVNMEYTDQIHIALAYEDGIFTAGSTIQKEEIIPPRAKHLAGGNLYIVTPVYYQNCCFGYCVSGNSSFPLKSELFYSWVMNIGVGLENIRKWILLNETVKRLNGMWVYDMLTHIYNRAGFFHFSAQLLANLKEREEQAFIIFADIDGLKSVNDNLGHDKGDLYIKEIADILRQNAGVEQILMRYGGDEFVLFGKSYGEEKIRQQVEDIKHEIQKRNEEMKYDFSLDASIGISEYDAKDIVNLDELIELADKRMYEEKRRKKLDRR